MARATTLGVIDILDPSNFLFAAIISLIFMCTSAFWIWRLSVSLKLFKAMFIIPINQTMWILFSVLSGGLVYNEFAHLKVEETMWLITGLILVLVGIVLLMPIDKAKAEAMETDKDTGSPLRRCCSHELNVRWYNGSTMMVPPAQI